MIKGGRSPNRIGLYTQPTDSGSDLALRHCISSHLDAVHRTTGEAPPNQLQIALGFECVRISGDDNGECLILWSLSVYFIDQYGKLMLIESNMASYANAMMIYTTTCLVDYTVRSLSQMHSDACCIPAFPKDITQSFLLTPAATYNWWSAPHACATFSRLWKQRTLCFVRWIW